MSALDGVRVLDLSRLMPGAFCTQLLADFGADVIKIEHPIGGDPARGFLPMTDGTGSLFALTNRNKRSVTLDLKPAEGRELFLRLAATADVVFETFRPGVMERLQLGYAALSEVNPRLVYATLSGFGQAGPYRDRAAHDLNYLSLAGITAFNAAPDGAPVPPAVQIADLGGATLAAFAILAALMVARQTGRGQRADASLFGSALAWLPPLLAPYLATGRAPGPGEPPLAGGLPQYHLYATRDGRYISLGALEPKFLATFLERVERPDLMALAARSRDSQRLRAGLQAVFLERTQADWIEFLGEVDTCFAPVNSLEEALADPQAQAMGMIGSVMHPTAGALLQLGVPVVLSETPGSIREPPPFLGQHTLAILQDLGLSRADVDDLAARAIV